MRISWGGRQTLALLSVVVVLVGITIGVQLIEVVRYAGDAAVNESGLVAQGLLLQIGHLVREQPDMPVEDLGSDPRIQLNLDAAIAQTNSLVFVAICDADDRAVAHTLPEAVGTVISRDPQMPPRGTVVERVRLMRDLFRSPSVYKIVTPLRIGNQPFASIRVGVAGILLREQVKGAFRRSLAVASLPFGLAIILGFMLAQITGRRIRLLEDGVAALRAGRFDARIPLSGVDEFARLARDLNLLGEQFQREREDRDSRMSPLRQTVELLGEGVLTLGPAREVLLINDATGRILAVDPSAAKGRRIAELLREDHPVSLLVERLFSDGTGPLTIPLEEGGGADAYVAVGHRIAGATGLGGALIEFKPYETLERIHSIADQSQVLSRLAQMAAGVAHEIRNPLQTINLELAALRRSGSLSAEEVEHHVRTAQEETQRLQRAVSGFLKVARLRQLAPVGMSLNQIAEEVRNSMEAEANLSGLDLGLALAPDLPETLADREVLRQAVQNLVKNAIQALPSRDGRIVIRTGSNASSVSLSVEDSGPGIPPELRDRVFDLYFTTKDGGTGVGLSLVRQAAEMHGGRARLGDTPAGGTSATIELPIRRNGGGTGA